MTRLQQAFAILLAVATLGGIVELVRRRRLKEEYALLWILTAGGMIVLASWYGLIEVLTRAIGAVTPTTTLFIFALFFLLAISVHFSIVISRLTEQVRRLTQELAIHEATSGDAAAADEAEEEGPRP
jgi:Mg2+/citrate symporter